MTKNKLEKFIAIRNESSHHNNLQFGIDCETAGFKVEELGEPIPLKYAWTTPHGLLVEHMNGKLELIPLVNRPAKIRGGIK